MNDGWLGGVQEPVGIHRKRGEREAGVVSEQTKAIECGSRNTHCPLIVFLPNALSNILQDVENQITLYHHRFIVQKVMQTTV